MNDFEKDLQLIPLVQLNSGDKQRSRRKLQRRVLSFILAASSVTAGLAKATADTPESMQSVAAVTLDTLATQDTTVGATTPATFDSIVTADTTALIVPDTSTQSPSQYPDSSNTATTNPAVIVDTTIVPNPSVIVDTTIPSTTTPPELGIEFSLRDNDQDNITTIGQYVTYNLSINNLDAYKKVFNSNIGFFDEKSLGELYNIRLSNCGSPEVVDNRRNYELYNITVGENGVCSITFDASVVYTGGMMKAFSNLYPVSGTNNYYDTQSETLYSR